MITITVTDTATPHLVRLGAGIRTQQTGPVAGRAAVNLIRRHLIAYNAAHGNKLGGKRTNFWTKAARSAHMQPSPDGASISIDELGFRLQYQGGTVRPDTKKFLTIPAVPEAYAKSADDFPDLEFAFVPYKGRMSPALVRARQTHIKIRKGAKGRKVTPVESSTGTEVIFWLRRRVTIPARPDALPTSAQMSAASAEATASYCARLIQRSQDTSAN